MKTNPGLYPSPLLEVAQPRETRSLWLGALAVAAFSLTLPITRDASAYLDPGVIAFGRAAVAGLVAIVFLVEARAPWPSRRQWRELAVIAGGVVFGFPLAAGWAMARVPAAHGGIVVGLLPLATAWVGSRLVDERLGARFWIAAIAGSTAVGVFAFGRASGHSGAADVGLADAALLVAIVAAAVGYAFSGRLSRELGGARVIAWALVLGLPLSIPLTLFGLRHGIPAAPSRVWVGLVYLALVSQLGAFFVWNHALARGGIARVSQTQLLQPFFTVVGAAWLLGEAIEPRTLGFALVVIGTVAIGRRARPSPSSSTRVPSVTIEPTKGTVP